MLYVSYSWADPTPEGDQPLLANIGAGFGASLFDDRGAPRSPEDVARIRDDIQKFDPEHPDRQVVVLWWTELL